MHRLTLAASTLALLAGSAIAQVGTPPPAKSEPMQEPVFTPEPPMSPEKTLERARERVALKLREDLFNSLIRRDDNGKIIKLEERVDVAALMNFPRWPEDRSTLKPHELMAYPRFSADTVEQIQVALDDRRAGR